MYIEYISISIARCHTNPVQFCQSYYFLLHLGFENRDSKREAIQTTVRLRPGHIRYDLKPGGWTMASRLHLAVEFWYSSPVYVSLIAKSNTKPTRLGKNDDNILLLIW